MGRDLSGGYVPPHFSVGLGLEETMGARIIGVEPGSPAHQAGLRCGEILLRIGAHSIRDVLDYQFYMTDELLLLEVADENNQVRKIQVCKESYEDLGLSFETYLMDKKRGCKNHCVFCFIDQLPKGLRKTLYFKDDDARLSFLMGNYITLTNLTQQDVDRIIEMHISPINVSVHTTNPDLRSRMMGNPKAGEALRFLYQLAEAGTKLNCQLVLCPGLNDGEELTRSLNELGALFPSVQSVSAVPVGISRYREGLYPLRSFYSAEAQAVVTQIEQFGNSFFEKNGTRLAFASDEFYIKAKVPFPDVSFYEDFPQLENGVGMVSLLTTQFYKALSAYEGQALAAPRRVTMATGVAAYTYLNDMAHNALAHIPGLSCDVRAIKNIFFGEEITVAGLITGGDLVAQLNGNLNCDELLLPGGMLRAEGDLFLDGLSLADVQCALGVKVRVVENDGYAVLDALTGE